MKKLVSKDGRVWGVVHERSKIDVESMRLMYIVYATCDEVCVRDEDGVYDTIRVECFYFDKNSVDYLKSLLEKRIENLIINASNADDTILRTSRYLENHKYDEHVALDKMLDISKQYFEALKKSDKTSQRLDNCLSSLGVVESFYKKYKI